MAHETFAPWAELVPDAGRMTVDEMLALPNDGWMYELIEGRLVRMPGSGGGASTITANLIIALGAFVKARQLGRVTGSDGTYDLTQPGDTGETALVPDVAFVRAEHVPSPTSSEYARGWKLAPDLVEEVVSPSQYRPEMAAKARLYLERGVRLVWVIWPKPQQVDVWRQGSDAPVAALSMGDTLDGLDVVPGFSYPLTELFA